MIGGWLAVSAALVLAACGAALSDEPSATETGLARAESRAATSAVSHDDDSGRSEAGQQPAALPDEARRPERVFFVGHSLISEVPDMVASLCAAPPISKLTFKEQFIPGAPLRWQWAEAERAKAPGYAPGYEPQFRGAYHVELAKGGWDALVLVEGMPMGRREDEVVTVEHLARFANFARAHNPGLRVLFYEPWPCLRSGAPDGCPDDTTSPTRDLAWRERLDANGVMWERIVAAASERLEGQGPKIELVPVARALGQLSDAIARGELEGFATREQLFEDEVHLSTYGKYFASLVLWSALFERSPVGRPVTVNGRWGNAYWDSDKYGKLYPTPKPAAARRMQEIAAQALGR